MKHDIHPTAIIDSGAELGDDVHVGPFAIVEAGAVIGDGTVLLARSHIMAGTVLGKNNEVHPGAVLGGIPQDRAFATETCSKLVIGDENIIRENATMHRATTPGSTTTVGHRGFFMANSHLAHDCVVGNDVIICNNATLAGYVRVGDRAFISGNVVIHQFTRIGELCMLGGGAAAGQDAPPFSTVIGRSRIRGLNVVGMKRAGIDARARKQIKELYKRIFAARGSFDDVLGIVSEIEDGDERAKIRDFYLADSKRGMMWPPSGQADTNGLEGA